MESLAMRSVNVKFMALSASLLVLSLCAAAADLPGSRTANTSAAHAAQPSFVYPANFDGTGILQEVDLRGNRLMIDALSYGFDPNAKVHTLQTPFATLHALRGEMEVGYKLRSGGRTGRTITEIWQLPAGSVIRH
jgi:hypothetical protein